MGSRYSVRHPARILALVFCISVVLGGSLPDVGNIATVLLRIEEAHYFNFYFLVAGLMGIAICGIALCRGLRHHSVQVRGRYGRN